MSIIVIDGLDGSGKTTQSGILIEHLRKRGKPARLVSFPDYSSLSSGPVKMYLAGAFGSSADDVGPYAASSFYAVDRYASFKKDWQKDVECGTMIVANRYTTSNIIHQMSKLPKPEWDGFIGWLYDFEYVKLGLPKPDLVIYLDVHPDVSAGLITGRYGGDERKKDIHERDLAYLLRCRESAVYAAEKLGWAVIAASDEQSILTVDEVAAQILNAVSPLL